MVTRIAKPSASITGWFKPKERDSLELILVPTNWERLHVAAPGPSNMDRRASHTQRPIHSPRMETDCADHSTVPVPLPLCPSWRFDIGTRRKENTFAPVPPEQWLPIGSQSSKDRANLKSAFPARFPAGKTDFVARPSRSGVSVASLLHLAASEM